MPLQSTEETLVSWVNQPIKCHTLVQVNLSKILELRQKEKTRNKERVPKQMKKVNVEVKKE
jgi:hypothetical protein